MLLTTPAHASALFCDVGGSKLGLENTMREKLWVLYLRRCPRLGWIGPGYPELVRDSQPMAGGGIARALMSLPTQATLWVIMSNAGAI